MADMVPIAIAHPNNESIKMSRSRLLDPDGTVLRKEWNGTAWQFTLPVTGLYEFVVTAQQSDVSYTLKITIR